MGALEVTFYCNECGEPYEALSEFRCICPPCAKEMGLAEETETTDLFSTEYAPR